MTVGAGQGGSFGPNDNASVSMACVPKGGFLVTIIFWVNGFDDKEACQDLGFQQIGVWDQDYFYNRFHHLYK